MCNSNKGIPHGVREGLIACRIILSIVGKVSRTHNIIIHLFDKPLYPWYKFSRGKVLEVRNVLVWGYYGLDRNVLEGEGFEGS